MPVAEERSLGQILRELRDESSELLRKEVTLAKVEMSEKASRVGTNLGSVATGGAVAFAGALALLAAVVFGLTSLLERFMSPGVATWLAPLLVGLVLAFIGYGMIQKALAALKHESLTPTQTTESLKENKEWLKARMQ
jgi:Putative Actinobacterial Holin-X, holin superfamily III